MKKKLMTYLPIMENVVVEIVVVDGKRMGRLINRIRKKQICKIGRQIVAQ